MDHGLKKRPAQELIAFAAQAAKTQFFSGRFVTGNKACVSHDTARVAKTVNIVDLGKDDVFQNVTAHAGHGLKPFEVLVMKFYAVDAFVELVPAAFQFDDLVDCELGKSELIALYEEKGIL